MSPSKWKICVSIVVRFPPKAKDALKWAAYTYVIAAIGSIATLLYYVAIAMGGRRD